MEPKRIPWVIAKERSEMPKLNVVAMEDIKFADICEVDLETHIVKRKRADDKPTHFEGIRHRIQKDEPPTNPCQRGNWRRSCE
jgi:hypothetical protein